MYELGVTECLRVKEQAFLSVSEAAELNLRLDEIIRCAPRRREDRDQGESIAIINKFIV
jgi:T-complex protein 1 subunit beta